MVQKVLLLNQGSAWLVPEDWNSSNNTIYCWGAGANGLPDGGGGGGGGACAFSSNISLTPGNVVPIQIGAGGSHIDTSFNNGQIMAKAGVSTVGGQASASIGTTKFSGGSGAGGGYGGGAANTTSAGSNYSAGSGATFTITVEGGTVRGGTGGAPGTSGSSYSDDNGTYYTDGTPGEPGLAYGGGGGSGGAVGGGMYGGTGGPGAQGCIVVVYDGDSTKNPYTFVSVGTRTVTATATANGTIPTGTTTGDILFAFVTYRNNAATNVIQSAGSQTWTQIYNQTGSDELTTTSGKTGLAIFQYIRTSTAPTTPTFAMVGNSGSVLGMGVQIAAYRGPGFSIRDSGSQRLTSVSASFSFTGPPVTDNGNMVIFIPHSGRSAGDITSVTTDGPYRPSSVTSTARTILIIDQWTERADSGTTTGADSWMGIYDTLARSGSTGNIAVTTSATAMWAGVYIVFHNGHRRMSAESTFINFAGYNARTKYSGYTESRIMIGKHWDGMQKIVISRQGIDAGIYPQSDENFFLSSDWPSFFPIYLTGSASCNTSGDTTVTFPSLGYIPIAVCWWFNPTNGRYEYSEYWQTLFFFAFGIATAPKVRIQIRDGAILLRNRTSFSWSGSAQATRTVHYAIFRYPLVSP